MLAISAHPISTSLDTFNYNNFFKDTSVRYPHPPTGTTPSPKNGKQETPSQPNPTQCTPLTPQTEKLTCFNGSASISGNITGVSPDHDTTSHFVGGFWIRRQISSGMCAPRSALKSSRTWRSCPPRWCRHRVRHTRTRWFAHQKPRHPVVPSYPR